MSKRALWEIWLASATLLGAQVSVLTWHNDSQRTGQNLQETILTPENVRAGSFGRLAVLSVDGKVDAQPLYVPGVTIPAKACTTSCMSQPSTAAFMHSTLTSLRNSRRRRCWEPTRAPSDDHGCSQVTPEIGITATPVIDSQAGPIGTIYAIAQSKDSAPQYHHRLHALDLATSGGARGRPRRRSKQVSRVRAPRILSILRCTPNGPAC